jgi:hypothetical protein
MPGFRSDHINLIADNLRDRYKSGFPILKELIQNADDAQARRLVFGYHPGFPGVSQHLLLQGPALWVFNDGEFNVTDKRAIQSFGLNSKAGDSGAIGKFGLGMKSVFHLCEAFFYVAFDGRDNHGVILNPWHDPEEEDIFHNEWEVFSDQDQECIRGVTKDKNLSLDGKSWLLLWVPLRMRRHVPEKDGRPYGAIVDSFPGDSATEELAFLKDSKLPRRIAAILPQLKYLETVEFSGSDNLPAFKLHLTLDQGSQRIDHVSPMMVSSGYIEDGSPRREQLKFLVRQKSLVGDEPFCSLKQLNAWPKTRRQNNQGIREPVSDKSEAEGAVLIAHADGEGGKLQIQWAVFLPTDEGVHTYECRLENTSRNYQIVLHGQFFVDAGRRGIAGFRHLAEPQITPQPDLDDADLHIAWNQAVAQNVVLPELIRSLADYASKHLKDDEIESLTRAIEGAYAKSDTGGIGSAFYTTYKKHICNRNAWVRQLLPDGPKWTCIELDSSHKLLRLPAPPKTDSNRPWQVLPKLREIRGAIFCDASAPALVPSFDTWDEEMLLTVLEVSADSALLKETDLKYLVAFLEMEQKRYIGIDYIQKEILLLLQRALRKQTLETFRGVKTPFQSLVALLQPQYRVAIGAKKVTAGTSLDESTLKLLICCETKLLLLPSDLDPPEKESHSNGQPDDGDIGQWVSVIDKEIRRYTSEPGCNEENSAKRVKQLLNAATALLELCGPKEESKARIIRMHRSARILIAIDARTGVENAIDFKTLLRAHEQGRLFKQGDMQTKLGHAKQLALALKESDVWVISAEISKYMEDDGSKRVPSATDGKAILESLGQPDKVLEIEGLESRRELLKLVHQSAEGTAARRGLRYLLHASPQHYMEDDATLWIEPGQGNTPWVKLWRAVEPSCWNVLEANLASHLAPNEWGVLGISQVKDSEVLRKLKEIDDFSLIDAMLFSDIEREIILGGVLDKDIWCLLPLHLDSKERFGPIDEKCFLDPNFILPDALADCCRIIKTGKNRDYKDNQKNWIPAWTALSSIRMALQDPMPNQHWKLILDALEKLNQSDVADIPEFRTSSWLPLSNGETVCPEDVIDIEELADDIDLLSSQSGYCFAGINGLAAEVKQHQGFPLLRKMLATEHVAFSQLGQLMTNANGYSIGVIGKWVEDGLKDLLPVLAQLVALPAWSIVAKVVAVSSLHEASEHLLPELSQELPLGKLTEILNEVSTLGSTEEHRSVFNVYLKQLVKHGNIAKAELEKIRFMSRAGTWQAATQLCVGATGIARQYQLQDDQAGILAGLIEDSKVEPLVNAAPTPDTDMVNLLEKYFRPWGELMQPGPVGAFLALLGLPARDLAKEWLAPHSFEVFAELIGWVDPGRHSDGALKWMGEKSVTDALNLLQPQVSISMEDQMQVASITGEMIIVELDDDFDTILVGKPFWNGGYSVSLYLRNIPRLGERSASDLSLLLKQTCVFLLREAYEQKHLNLGPLWDELEKSDQLSLAIARDLILDNLSFYLQQLKVAKRSPLLQSALDDLNRLQQEKSEAAMSQKATGSFEVAIRNAKEALAKLMTQSPEVQKIILEGVKDRVKQNQYEVSSIVFELFQNADDAVAELQALQREDGCEPYPVESIGRFVSENGSDVVRLIHWGRPINYTGHGKARNQVYQDDLKNMLILSGSDKDEAGGVTGKFGLGFKSVLLATDCPCILSADIKVKIMGGCLPEPWTNADGALEALQRHRGSSKIHLRGTVVELEVPDPQKRIDLLARFSALAGIQSVFSREIRSIEANGKKHTWKQSPLFEDCDGVEFDSINLPDKSGLKLSKLLVLRGKGGAIALKVGSRGVEKFSDKVEYPVPSIWVTCPTREAPATGLALNANFELDTGRGVLPHGTGSIRNQQKAEELATGLGKKLHAAVKWSRKDWVYARERMGLVHDLSAAEFWSGFFESVCAQFIGEGESAKLLQHFGKHLFDHFVTLTGETPNGLPCQMAYFIKADDIRLAVSDRWVKALPLLQSWPEFTRAFPVTGWVSEIIADALQPRSDQDGDARIPLLSINLLFSVVQNDCSSESALMLASILADMSPSEVILCAQEIRKLRFKAVDGSWQVASDLLKDANDTEESLCSGFAPDRCKLDEIYQGEGRQFILEHGVSWSPKPQIILQWILDVTDPEGRFNALRYLLRGACAYSVRSYLKEILTSSWLDSLQFDSPLLQQVDDDEKKQLIAILNPSYLSNGESAPIYPWMHPASLQGTEALEAIHNWWIGAGQEQLEVYYRHFWPAEIPRVFEDNVDKDRSAWMTLFSIGLMQRIGRNRDFQNRGFIDVLVAKGWWNVFCNVRPQDVPEDWMNVLKEYGESQVETEEYGLWMDIFPRLYRMARWLETYVHIFLSLDQRTILQSAAYLSPSADTVLSGSSIDAPTLLKSLRMGQHVIVRELLRAGKLQSETAKYLAYMPAQRVRNLLDQIGYPDVEKSEDIYKLLTESLGERAVFGGAYDIPLLLLAENTDLQNEVLSLSSLIEEEEEEVTDEAIL